MSPLLTHWIPVSSLSAKGRTIKIVATPEETAAVADLCGLEGLENLRATFHASKGGGALIAVQGDLEASVIQICGVSLKPIKALVQADIAITYTLETRTDGKEVDVDPDAGDPPEPVIDGQIDFWALAIEHLALNLDPYPRAKNIVFDAGEWSQRDMASEEDMAPSNPFAALSALKTDQKGH